MVALAEVLAAIDSLNPEFSAKAEHSKLEISGLAPLEQASANELSFIASAKYRRHLQSTGAGVVFVTEKEREHCPQSTLAIVVADPYLAYAKASQLFDQTPSVADGIDATAVVDAQASIASNVAIGAHVYIGKGAVIGENVQIGANSVIEDFAVVGANTRIGCNVTLAHRCEIGQDCWIQHGSVIGCKGFGYAPTEAGWQAIAQVGRVVIGDRVEIGSNCAIDRGAIADTEIADDVIIDNLVHIAHNVKVGHRTAIAAQVGFAGSTEVGASCTFGGQVGITGHIQITDNSHFSGQAMVTKGTTEAGLYASGIPAQDAREWRKMVARVRQLEAMNNRIKELENRLKSEEDK